MVAFTRPPRRMFVYGTSGIGKTTLGAMAPNSKFISIEDGLDDIDLPALGSEAFPLATSFDDVMANITELYTTEHDRQSLVVDSVDWLERLIHAKVAATNNVATIDDIGYGKGYKFALPHWQQFLDGLNALRRDRGMLTILLAHSKIDRFDNPETDPYDRYTPKLHELASALLTEWATEVLFVGYRVYTTSKDMGFNKDRTKGVGSGERVIRTEERPSHIAKNRLNLPYEIPLDWNELAKYL